MPIFLWIIALAVFSMAWFFVVCFFVGLIHHTIGSLIRCVIPRQPVAPLAEPKAAPVKRTGHAGKRQTLRGY